MVPPLKQVCSQQHQENRWHPAILVLLICAFSKWLLAADIQTQDPSLAGMPLSNAEYNNFFKTLNNPHRASAVCFLRSMYGCQNPLIQTLDLYENHGIVPEGRVCSNLAEMPSFPDFCTLTFYRCTLKKYFVKRIHCPNEISEASSTPPNTNRELENAESSSTLQETPPINVLPTTLHTTKPSSPLLTSVSSTPTAATETITTVSDTTVRTIPKHPSIISDSTSSNLLLDLPTSSTPVTTDSESLLELLTSLDAVIAGQSFPQLFTTKVNTAEGSFSQHLMTDVLSLTPAPTLPSNAMTATPATSVSAVPESSSEPTIPEVTTPSVGSGSTNPATTVAPASSPTSTSPSPTVTATEATTPSVGSGSTNPATTVAPASSPTSASPSPIVTVTTTEATTPPVGSVSTNPASTVAPASSPSTSPSPIVTVTATEATTPSVGSVSTNPVTTVAPASSPTSASPSPAVTEATTPTTSCSSSPSPSSSTASKASVAKPTIPTNPAHALPPAKVAEWPVVPISALLGQYPLQPTSVLQFLLLPPGFDSRKAKPQAVAISSLLPFGARPVNIWQKKRMPPSPMNLPTTAKWVKFLATKPSTTARLENPLPMTSPTAAQLESLIARLRDKRVQQLMQKMRELMAKGKGVQKQALQSTSLRLLSALNNAK